MPEDDQRDLTEAEIAKRRDEVIRRMANTKPAPKTQSKERSTRHVDAHKGRQLSTKDKP